MRVSVLITSMLLFSISLARAESFWPGEMVIERMAQRFRVTLKESGINGVGKDVLKCYDESLDSRTQLKECVLYDTAALMFDRVMVQIFIARGVAAIPAALFTNRVFDARQNTYGRMAFRDDPQSKKLVGPGANKVIAKLNLD